MQINKNFWLYIIKIKIIINYKNKLLFYFQVFIYFSFNLHNHKLPNNIETIKNKYKIIVYTLIAN